MVALVRSVALTMMSLRLRHTRMEKVLTAPNFSGALHVKLAQWIRAGYKTAAGVPIKHKRETRQSEKALTKPAAVVKCQSHCKDNTLSARGSKASDQAGEESYATFHHIICCSWKLQQQTLFHSTTEQLLNSQERVSLLERTVCY